MPAANHDAALTFQGAKLVVNINTSTTSAESVFSMNVADRSMDSLRAVRPHSHGE
jgi:hypothetical protein